VLLVLGLVVVLGYFFLPTQTDVELLAAFGSVVPDEAVPVAHTFPTDDRHGTETVTWADPPVGTLAHEQAIVLPATVHVAPDVAELAGAGPVN